jgi:hypothetical protein
MDNNIHKYYKSLIYINVAVPVHEVNYSEPSA